MAANMKRKKLLWLFLLTISSLFVFLVFYLRYKLGNKEITHERSKKSKLFDTNPVYVPSGNPLDKKGQLDCSGPKSSLPFQRYLLVLKKPFFGIEKNSEEQNSLLCGRDINELCMHILTKQLPEDVKYYSFDYIKDDPELQEFVFRISVVVGFVGLIGFCNFCKWMTANELHYDADYEEQTKKSNVSKAFEKSKVSNDTHRQSVSSMTYSVESKYQEPVTPPKKKKTARGRTWSMWKTCGVIIAIFALLSIPWEFARLYQNEVSKRAAHASIGSPPECFPGGMSIVQSLKSWLKHHFSWDHTSDPCEKYYYTLLVDPLWELTPLMVLSSAMTRCILHPIEQLFSGLGRSCRMFFSEIPTQWQPVIMVLLILLCLILLLMVFSYRISIPLLFRIEPKTPVQVNQTGGSRVEPIGHSHSPCGHNHTHIKLTERPSARLRIPVRNKPRKNRLDFEDYDYR